ncbi:MAG TPA: alpha/beta fold hydrolase [Acidimicrobiales bacterium]|nr:alpha/beta fold hydrolase [Acidimicrobiales bacterium]
MPLRGAPPAQSFLEVPVSGGRLTVAAWDGPGTGPAVLGIHGITGSSAQLAPVARRLGAQAAVLAPDLRGRGQSSRVPGPFGVVQHARDCARVVEDLAGGRPVVVLGESMGAFVAVMLAASRPELVSSLVLADGGLPAALPEGLGPDELMAAVLGPAMSRLDRVFPSREEYLAFWRAHPAFRDEWNDDVEQYLDYDVEEVDGGVRPRASLAAVRRDGIDVLVEHDLITAAAEALECDLLLVRACRDLVDEEPPLYPDEVVASWRARQPRLRDLVVPGTNHYTLFLGAAGAAALAAEVARAVAP